MPDYSKFSKSQLESELRIQNSKKANLTKNLGKPGYSYVPSQLNHTESIIQILVNLLSGKK